MRPGVKPYRAIGGKHEPFNILVRGDRQAELGTLDRSFFFEPIDSLEKARELVELGYPGAVVIETSAQYALIVKALRAKGWLPDKQIKLEKPSSYGVTVRIEPELGYRVTSLMIDHTNLYDLGSRNVMYREFAVASDGRMGMDKEVECILAPESETGAPPGWAQPLPMDPKPYNDFLRMLLTAEGSRSIPKVVVADRKAAIKCAEGEEPEWYVNDYEDWPENADE